ncbi:MmgE/PrpD family protein [Sphingomonas hengshuiensis]|uniref:MmgE/PrpD family protein n=1 Tax=Sphingomonas hengshuiensis TaxID=1609977 RepID=UPI0009812E33|nr:MmgE/PrpD family protein [Sphingomonas hengshuiensis]
MADDESLTERIVRHARRPKSEAVRARARLHLLDWLGCVAGALRSPVAEVQRAAGCGSAIDRAGWLGNVLEMDDIHRSAILHPGPVIWPTALAVPDAPLDAALDAAIGGYEAMILVGAMFDANHYRHWHTTATAGTFGAAMTAALAIGADEAQCVSALGLAGSVTGGLWQMRHEPVMAKQWHLAHAVRTGRAAAVEAANGITGPRYILEGPQGLFAASCARAKPLALGDGWQLEQVSFKPWGACRHAHPAIDAALTLRAQGQLVLPVHVGTYRDAITFCDRPSPASVVEAKFSLQHAIAIVVARGVPQLADFEPEAIAELAPLRAQVTVAESSAITAAYPAHYGARVSCDAGVVALVDTLGDPERPMDGDAIVEKARTLMAWGGLDDVAAGQAIDAALQGRAVRDVTEIVAQWL